MLLDLSAGEYEASYAERLQSPLVDSQCHAASPVAVAYEGQKAVDWQSPAGRIQQEGASYPAGARSSRHGAPADGSVRWRCRG